MRARMSSSIGTHRSELWARLDARSPARRAVAISACGAALRCRDDAVSAAPGLRRAGEWRNEPQHQRRLSAPRAAISAGGRGAGAAFEQHPRDQLFSNRSIFRSIESISAPPTMSAPPAAIPTAAPSGLRSRARSRSAPRPRPNRCSSICCPKRWTGPPPGLPREVVEDLARRTREAERMNRQQVQLAQNRKSTPVRVRVSKQPTFTRYVFELPELTGVSTDRGKDKLTLVFAAPLRFDLADAKLDIAAGRGRDRMPKSGSIPPR